MVIDAARNFLSVLPVQAASILSLVEHPAGSQSWTPQLQQSQNFGLKPVSDFRGINRDAAVWKRIASAYKSVDDVDVWVGGLTEAPGRDGIVGETVSAVLRDQFIRLRDGDRFWYQNYLGRELQQLIEQQTLTKIIRPEHRDHAGDPRESMESEATLRFRCREGRPRRLWPAKRQRPRR